MPGVLIDMTRLAACPHDPQQSVFDVQGENVQECPQRGTEMSLQAACPSPRAGPIWNEAKCDLFRFLVQCFTPEPTH